MQPFIVIGERSSHGGKVITVLTRLASRRTEAALASRALVSAALVLSSASSAAQTIGLIDARPQAVTLQVVRPLARTDRVTFQYKARAMAPELDDAKKHCCVQYPASAFRLLPSENGLTLYRLKPALPAQVDDLFLAAAIAAPASFKVRQSRAGSLLTKGLHVETCLSREGLHVRGLNDADAELDVLYRPLEYTVESPTC